MTDNEVTVIISGHEMVTILKLSPVKIIYGCQTTNNHELYNCCTIMVYLPNHVHYGCHTPADWKGQSHAYIKGNFEFITHISRQNVQWRYQMNNKIIKSLPKIVQSSPAIIKWFDLHIGQVGKHIMVQY